MRRFSRRFATYEEWDNAIVARLIPQLRYYSRVVGYLAKHPDASLRMARGHAPKVTVLEPEEKVFLEEVREEAQEEEEEETWRIGYGAKDLVAIHGEYYGALIQAWADNKEELLDIKLKLKDKCMELLEDFLDYRSDEWWFGFWLGFEPPMEIVNDPWVWTTWMFCVEKEGRIVFQRTGRNEVL